MKAVRNVTLLSLLIMCSLTFLGCGEEKQAASPTGAGVSESKPISEVKAEAEKMDAAQLRAIALKYKAVIDAKAAEMDKLAKDIMKSLGAEDVSEKTKELNARRMAELGKSGEALGARLAVYLEKLKEKGGDLSGLDI
ncbi:MAG: hypothetical protein JW720_11625 [Sedimentisphaerales bacterium]|nr:hypothetical protein [Sedimentisphaerales bacterium]